MEFIFCEITRMEVEGFSPFYLMGKFVTCIRTFVWELVRKRILRKIKLISNHYFNRFEWLQIEYDNRTGPAFQEISFGKQDEVDDAVLQDPSEGGR